MKEIVDYLYQIPRFARTGGLEQTQERLRLLGSPEKSFRYIHVAGTNGKGSTCAYIESVLRHMGFKTGLFTSPHLIRINERIRINNTEISNEAFIKAFHKVKDLIDAQMCQGIAHPTFFEFIYLMAMCAFKDAGIEYGIIETGLGGRLDLTNAVEEPELTVITSISLDHTAILGDTVEKIAVEKAGIIKGGVPLVYLDKCPEVSEVLIKKSEEKDVSAFAVRNHWVENVSMDTDRIEFTYRCPYFKKYDIILKSNGMYQMENASLAITALEVLRLKCGWTIGELDFYRSIQDGLADMRWAGRMEMVGKDIYVDGAHNDDAILQFVASVNQMFREQDIYLVFAVAEDKDYRQMVCHLSQIRRLKGVIVTEIDNGRRRDFHEVLEDFKKNWHGKIDGTYNVNEAIVLGKQWKGQNGILICTGSLYLVGHVKEILGGI